MNGGQYNGHRTTEKASARLGERPTLVAGRLSPAMTPYLTLPHLLSLAWLAYPIISLLFVAFRLILSLDASESTIASAKADLLAGCLAAEHAATSAASMPRYMAIATNKQFADAVNDTMSGAREVLVLALTVMEAVINFMVDIYRSTFLCFLELIVQAALGLLITATQAVSLFHVSATKGRMLMFGHVDQHFGEQRCEFAENRHPERHFQRE